ncbi:Zinc finger FYVE domain-containing protein 19 [Verticillium dahliae VDG1]|nr:Zinc finger FYVE domain-containing protein 19 [Verticillium dahliae VDG1]
MPLRRPHTKSRFGCANCKRRKVKCDESRPFCRNCHRHGVRCSFVIDKTWTTPELLLPIDPRLSHSLPGAEYYTPESLHDPPPAPLSMPTPLPASSDMWALSGLELMHHFTISTAHTLSFRSDVRHIWRCRFPQIGYDHPFVMHGLLSLAALHKAALPSGSPGQREQYLDLAAYHQGLGMATFMAGIVNINAGNWKPLMCFSSCVLIYVCFRPSHTVAGLTAGSSEAVNIFEVFAFVRGHRAVLERYQSTLKKSYLSPLFHSIWRPDDESEVIWEEPAEGSLVPEDVFRALDKLSEFLEQHVPPQSQEAYTLAMQALQRLVVFVKNAGPDPEFGMLIMFAYVVPDTVVGDIQSFDPNALALLAYFSVSWKMMEPRFWFMKGWSHDLFELIDQQVAGNEEMEDIIDWPRRQVQWFEERNSPWASQESAYL